MFFRSDEWVQDALGNAISGAQVYVCSQPATTSNMPPSPLVQLYADSAGATPITQPVLTDGYGHAFYYLASGTYTVLYYSPQIQTVILTDQNITSPVTSGWNNDGSNLGTITPAPDGSTTVFTLSGTPTPPSSLLFAVNGLTQVVTRVSGNQVTLSVAPHASSLLYALYQTTV